MATDLLDALPVLRKRFCDLATTTNSAGDEPDDQPIDSIIAGQQEDGAWSDIDYTDAQLGPWDAARHLRRVLRLATAWYRDGEQDDNLLDAILRGLRGWYARDMHNPNWWHNDIGTPTLLGDILLLIQPACPRELITAAVPSFESHQPALRFTGQNMIWVAAVQIRHGILTDTPALVSQGYILAGRELRVVAPEEEGLQVDMSFYQHGTLLYSGGYGQGFSFDLARLITSADGTPYAFPDHKIDLLIRMVLDGSRWMIRGRTFDYSAIGREISRPGHSADRLFAAAQLLAHLDHPRQAELAELANAPAGSTVDGNRCFWRTDYMVQHRPAYAISIRVPSNRVWNVDMACCGGEGRVCHHMAEGATFLYTDGNDYRDIFPVWNWHQVPGTTAEQRPDFDPDTLRIKGASPFAGGVTDGRIGCLGAIIQRDTLRARRGWFLFDDTLVALGAGITCDSDHPVRTTLAQRHASDGISLNGAALADGKAPLSGGDCFRQGTLAWHLLDGTGALRVGGQTGAWSDCGVRSATPITLPVLNAGISHGVRPQNATCAYAIRIGDDLAPPPVDILANAPDLQAVWHRAEQRGHAIYYTPGAISFPDGQCIEAAAPCFLLYLPKGNGATLVLASPTETRIPLTLTGRLQATLDIPLPDREYQGASHATTLHLP